MSATRGIYADYWDQYVDQYTGDSWPGDEWGDEAWWNETFDRLFVPAGVAGWNQAIEIGSGSGKYTERVLGANGCTVHAFDVSERFLNVLSERCATARAAGRLHLTLLNGSDPDQMLRTIEQNGWSGSADAVYSIDAMVHVDLQYLVSYLLTAGLVLKPGGALVMTFADACTDSGFKKLIGEIRAQFPRQADRRPSAKFEWLGPEVVRVVLERLGFTVRLLYERRDLEIVATLTYPERSAALRTYLIDATATR